MTASARGAVHARARIEVSASPAAAAEPAIVGVTTGGALVTLNPTTGAVERTLVPSEVIGAASAGGEVSVTQSGMVCLGEADYLPDGNLFVSRFCCQGWPGTSTSSLVWEVTTSGAPARSTYPTAVRPRGR